jgi:hypothetical protein
MGCAAPCPTSKNGPAVRNPAPELRSRGELDTSALEMVATNLLYVCGREVANGRDERGRATVPPPA